MILTNANSYGKAVAQLVRQNRLGSKQCHVREAGNCLQDKHRFRKKSQEHPIEAVGKDLRGLMAWVKSHDDDYVEGSAAR